jgi:hypothetical protein
MTRQFQAQLLMAAFVALTACSDPFAPADLLELMPRESSYRPGGLLELEVRNAGDRTVRLGACPSGLYGVGSEGTPWIPYNHPCPTALYSLAAGQTLTMTWELPTEVPPGTYEVGVAFHLEESERSGAARSHAIEIVN